MRRADSPVAALVAEVDRELVGAAAEAQARRRAGRVDREHLAGSPSAITQDPS